MLDMRLSCTTLLQEVILGSCAEHHHMLSLLFLQLCLGLLQVCLCILHVCASIQCNVLLIVLCCLAC
jgi:hypothetical protein